MKVNIGVSARHVHVTKDDLKQLFGEGYVLTKKIDLSQPGQFSCNEQVTLEGPKGVIERVRILGPERSQTQVEISKTDSFKLGINPPVRNSGCLDAAAEITIIGPKGKITKNAAIIASRHVHANTQQAIERGLYGKEFVSLRIEGEKPGTLDNLYVRISDNYDYEVHLDTDDANAFLIKNGDEGEIIIK